MTHICERCGQNKNEKHFSFNTRCQNTFSMAATRRALCFTCANEIGQVTCDGCSRTFCIRDFNGHRQDLDAQLGEIETDRDAFRQSLTEAIAEPKNNALIEQINRWENESHDKIRQVAEEARQKLEQYIGEFNTRLENKLKTLTVQVQASRNKNAFSETDLDEWGKQLLQMKNELEKPPNMTIIHSPPSLISKIDVCLNAPDTFEANRNSPNHNSPKYPRRFIPVKQDDVTCTFCTEEVPASEIGNHLMTCGNKTRQCPSCGKFIRRAIFAYHYENKCANLDELDANENTSTQQTNNPATLQPEIQPPFLSTADVNTLDEKRRVIIPMHLQGFPQQSTTATGQTGSVAFYKPKKMAVPCQHCFCQCEFSELKIHETNCLRNPDNIKKKFVSHRNTIREQNPSQSSRAREATNNETIPCEICQTPVEWRDFDTHMHLCIKRAQKSSKK